MHRASVGYVSFGRSAIAVGFLTLSTFAALGSVVMGEEKAADKAAATLDRTMKTLGGDTVDLNKYKGKVVLIVNTASECGLTPQYTGLQALYEQYKDQGLVVLGFPCNQFGKQEPGTAKEISEFCTANYGVTFDMFDKVEVNGEGACDLYKQLTTLDLKPKGSGKVSWNFEKFLLDRHGNPVARFDPKTAPDDEVLVAAIKKQLESK